MAHLVMAALLSVVAVGACASAGSQEITQPDGAAAVPSQPLSAVGAVVVGETPTPPVDDAGAQADAPLALATATGADGVVEERVGAPASGRPAAAPLEVGACLVTVFVTDPGAPLGPADLPRPCEQPHDAEVIAVVALSEQDVSSAPSPGASAVERVVQQRVMAACLDAFPTYTGEPYATSNLRLALMAPSAASWADGDRTGVCSVYDGAYEPLVGSVLGRRPPELALS